MQLLLKYAIEKDTGRMVHIDEVANGKACGCVCPECKQPLVAKNGGKKNEHHFAHSNDVDCHGGRMTALHMLAQNIIANTKTVMLPDYTGKYYYKLTGCQTFDDVQLEVRCGDMQPDCIGIKKDSNGKEHRLWIEILVTHKVDEQKKERIKEEGVSCIEIDLSDMLIEDYTKESLEQRLHKQKDDRVWINCPKYDEINKREEEKKKQKDEYDLSVKAAMKKMIYEWRRNGDVKMTKNIINIISGNPNSKESIALLEELMKNGSCLYYVEHSPHDEATLQLFYLLLHTFFNRIFVESEPIEQRLQSYQSNRDVLSAREKIELEQLISLKIIGLLERRFNEDYKTNADSTYKKIIDKYIEDKNIRKDLLMLSSIVYRHVVGSNAKSFGGLTREIIRDYPYLAKDYLTIIENQNRFQYSNNYYLDGSNTLEELREYVYEYAPQPSELVRKIIRECYSFAFNSSMKDMWISI